MGGGGFTDTEACPDAEAEGIADADATTEAETDATGASLADAAGAALVAAAVVDAVGAAGFVGSGLGSSLQPSNALDSATAEAAARAARPNPAG